MRVGIFNARVGVAESGGTEAFLRETMKRLQGDHELVLYTGTGDLLEEIREMDVRVEQIPFRPKEGTLNRAVTKVTPLLPAEVETLSMYASAVRRGYVDRIENEVDVLSLHYYLDAILLTRGVEVPNIFHFPGIKHPSVRWRLMARLAKPTLSLANSESTARRVGEWLDVDVDGVVYPGVDTAQFTPDAEPAIDVPGRVVLFVGRLDEGKGLPELVDAHAGLDGDPTLVLVGDGTLTDDLRARVERLGTGDRVRFEGAVPHERIQGYYAAADAFCLPSHHESFGIVNLEAMATGTPVVSTRIDAIEEYLVDGENGLLVEPGDVAGLTKALGRLLDDEDLRQRLGRQARDTAREYSWERQAEKLGEHYVRAAGR